MRISTLVGILLLSVCALNRTAAAEELFRYNYIEADYLKATADSPGTAQKINASLFGIAGSYAVHELVAIQAGLGKTKVNFNGLNQGISDSFAYNGTEIFLGLSLHKMVAESTEVGLDLAHIQATSPAFTEVIGGTANAVAPGMDNANSFAFRVRTALVPAFRLLASVGRTTGGALATTDYSAGVEYELGEKFSLGAGFTLNAASTKNSRGPNISGRYYF